MKLEQAIKTKKFSSPQFQVILEILFTAGCIDRDNNEKLKPYDISIQQFNILRILNGSHPNKLSVHEIKDRMVQKTPNTTRLIDKLITKDYVERVRCDKDRRVIYINISTKGIDLLNTINTQASISSNFINKLNTEEANYLITLLEKIRS